MIECKELTYAYENGTLALEAINFNASRGGIIGVIGSNGAGKSTLFKCLTGLVKPLKGAVLMEGSPLKYDKKSLEHLRQRVNVVQQDPERQIFFPRVYDDVAFGPRNLRWTQAQVDASVMESLEKTNLVELKDQAVHYLSFGQKKRTAIAGILAMKCDMMILDEPEAGLDPSMKTNMMKTLKNLSEEGTTIVVSSHNMDMILELCDYIYVLHKGRLIGEGPVLEVLGSESLMSHAQLEIPTLLRISRLLNLPLVRNEQQWQVNAITKASVAEGGLE